MDATTPEKLRELALEALASIQDGGKMISQMQTAIDVVQRIAYVAREEPDTAEGKDELLDRIMQVLKGLEVSILHRNYPKEPAV
ncbi:hypothetical protein NW762_008842 [Fusarium torreyae]|uniref:Uncharacterized protein n=1 Tax=Fusarium torreyae TaxID=1237075 RepID=A0A9W8RW35_9HYPO|nr:hypothetical protein NW762_008842 [Fusarium torreyae]